MLSYAEKAQPRDWVFQRQGNRLASLRLSRRIQFHNELQVLSLITENIKRDL